MPDIKQSSTVIYSPAQMYDLVNAVDDYPKFLPWCTETNVLTKDEDEIQATVVVSGMGFQKSFTTHNRLQKNKMIEIRLVDGPFRHLEGFWLFDEVNGGGCKVSLDLAFEFSGSFLDLAFGPIFHQIGSTFVDAFCKRAKEVYGES